MRRTYKSVAKVSWIFLAAASVNINGPTAGLDWKKKNVEQSSIKLLVLPVSETLIAVFGLLSLVLVQAAGQNRGCPRTVRQSPSSKHRSALVLVQAAGQNRGCAHPTFLQSCPAAPSH